MSGTHVGQVNNLSDLGTSVSVLSARPGGSDGIQAALDARGVTVSANAPIAATFGADAAGISKGTPSGHFAAAVEINYEGIAGLVADAPAPKLV